MDDGLDNFGVKIYPTGKKSYIVRIRFNGSKKEYVVSDCSLLSLAAAKDKARDETLFKLIYFTGLRAGEAMQLKWDNINFKNNSLHLSDTKNGNPLDIPLNSYAVELLQSIKEGEYKHKKYIFPSVDKKDNVVSMKYYSKSLSNLKKQGVMWSSHDSRRGFINAGGVSGCNSYMIKQLVNHSDNGQEAHAGYNHYTIGELRPTTETIGDYLFNQLHSTNVVEFKKTA